MTKVTQKSDHWADMEEAGAFFGLKFLALIYRIAGRRICLFFMFPVLLCFYVFKTTARRSVNEFREKLSRKSGSPQTGYWHGFSNFLNFGGAALDKLAAWNGDIKRENIVFPGSMQSLFELDADHQGAILFVSHLGNVEVIRASAALNQPRPITVLVHTKHAQKFNKLMTRFNKDSQLSLVEVTEIGPEVAMQLKACVDRGEWVVIAADRPPVQARGNVLNVPFLDHAAPFALGPYVLAHILEKPVYLVSCVRIQGKFFIEWSKLADKLTLQRKNRRVSAEKWARDYAMWLEGVALKYPDQWFNFFPFWASHKD